MFINGPINMLALVAEKVARFSVYRHFVVSWFLPKGVSLQLSMLILGRLELEGCY